MRGKVYVSACLAAAVLTGAAVVQAAPRLAVLDPAALPTLPAQGLVVERAHDVLLVGLDGKPIGALSGFSGPYTGKTYVLEALAQADPAAELLAGPAHRLYVLDPAQSRLRELHTMQLPLQGGAVLAAHAIPQKAPYLPTIVLSVVEHGQAVVKPSQFLRVVAGRLVVTPTAVVDTVSGRRWPVGNTQGALAGGCEPAGVAGASLIAVCAAGKAPLQVRAYAISGTGARKPLGPAMRWGFGARTAVVSPDGRFVGVTLDVGCGLPVGAIAPLGPSGHAGYIANGKPVGSAAIVNSEALGWTPDGKLIAHIIFPPTDCEHEPPTGVYAVDPATFARKLVYAVGKNEGVSLWDAALGPS